MIPFRLPKWVLGILEIPRDFDKLSAEFVSELKQNLSKFSTNNPTVSIVMPVYNEEENIVQTLFSLSKLNLNHRTELIVVNNNSTDRTQEILDKLGVKTFSQTRQGISYTRQLGLEMAKGKYHLCVDGDSIYHPEWLNEYIKHLEDESITVVYGPYSFIPQYGLSRRKYFAIYEIITTNYFRVRRRNKEFLNVLGFNFGFRTEDGRKVGGFNTSRPRWSDGWMAMTLQELGKIKFVKTEGTRVWTTARRINADGSLVRAFMKRVKKATPKISDNINKFKFS
ncbi:MAG: glycosyltransferase family 2 protein [Bacteroidetes bacterium]|nr:glycosyltransferase family 2 protein [Bacteroidota bacterium]